jgi:hypothetical protein
VRAEIGRLEEVMRQRAKGRPVNRVEIALKIRRSVLLFLNDVLADVRVDDLFQAVQ